VFRTTPLYEQICRIACVPWYRVKPSSLEHRTTQLYRETLDVAQFCRGYKFRVVEVPGTRVTGSRVTNARLGVL
jgi:hypothetical protein